MLLDIAGILLGALFLLFSLAVFMDSKNWPKYMTNFYNRLPYERKLDPLSEVKSSPEFSAFSGAWIGLLTLVIGLYATIASIIDLVSLLCHKP